MAVLTKLKKEDFNKILENYNIGRHKSHRHVWWALGNTVYILKTSRGKYVLKIFESSKPKYIEYEAGMMDFAQGKGLPIPRIIKTKSKQSLLTYNNKLILLQRFVEGKEPGKFNRDLIKDFAKNLGLLDKSLLRLKLTGKHTWGNHLFKPIGVSTIIYGFNFRKNEKLLLDNLKKIKKSQLRKSVIHSDFQGPNLLVKDNKITGILDWDDVHEDYLAFELAVSIAHTFITEKINKDNLRLFFREYQKHVKLRPEDKKAIYYFIRNRYLEVIAWCAEKQKEHADKHENIGKWISGTIRRYQAIDRMPLEEFLELF